MGLFTFILLYNQKIFISSVQSIFSFFEKCLPEDENRETFMILLYNVNKDPRNKGGSY